MNTLPMETRVRIIAALTEGMSLRATARLCDVNRETVGRLAVAVGEGCASLHDEIMRDLNIGVLELDEVFSFIGAKEKQVKPSHPDYFGTCYVHTALDASSKAIVAYAIGRRDAATANAFCADLRQRVLGRPQISTDGHNPYVWAIDKAFGIDCHYAQVIKTFEAEPVADAARRYSPGRIRSIEKKVVMGSPARHLISTSFVERSNLTIRMQQRRFTRLTNAFSKTLRGHTTAFSLFVAWYNLCWVVSTTRKTPCMALGITRSPLSIEDLVRLALHESEGQRAA
jgi:IS1 family transposase